MCREAVSSRDPGKEISDNSLKRRLLELRILNMYQNGKSVSEIARGVGLSRVSVYKILKKYR